MRRSRRQDARRTVCGKKKVRSVALTAPLFGYSKLTGLCRIVGWFETY